VLFSGSAEAASVRLAWDPSTGPDVAGYIVTWRPADATVEQTITVGNVTTWTLKNLTSGRAYVISVRAYSTRQVQSQPAEITAVAAERVAVNGGAHRLSVGQTATWLAHAWGFDNTVEYLFRRYSPEQGWIVVRDWASSPTFSWAPGPHESGRYVLDVLARQVGSTAAFQAHTSTGYIAVGDASQTVATTSRMDFDGDGRADPTVFRPDTATWYSLLSERAHTTSRTTRWGEGSDTPVPGDYDGDGRTDIAVYRPATGTWSVLSSASDYSESSTVSWGISIDVPVPGDYDGDGTTDVAVFRPASGTWFALLSGSGNAAYLSRAWGLSTDIPVPGDYDGDGTTDIGVFRPSSGTWYILGSLSNFASPRAIRWGMTADRPVPADYDGDGRVDLAVFRPSTGVWWILASATGFTTFEGSRWGVATDLAVPADYDGDGRADTAVYRPGSGTWFVRDQFSRGWGVATDTPVLAR
jgi:hypothetical protein